MESQTNDELTLIAFGTIEVVLSEPLTENEIFYLMTQTEREGIDATVNSNGRVIVFECDEIQDATAFLADLGVVEDVALIKIITELEPQWQKDSQFSLH